MRQQLQKQLARFALVGGLGFVVDIGFTLMLIEHGMDAFVSRVIAIALAMLTTWRLNRAITFGASTTSQTSEGARYFTVAILVAMLNYAVYAGLLIIVPSIPPGFAIVIAVGVATVFSFFGYRLFAFKTVA